MGGKKQGKKKVEGGGGRKRGKVLVGKEISYIWNGGSLLRGLYRWIVVSGLTLRMGIRWNSKEREGGGEQRYFELIQTRTSTIEGFGEKRVYHALRCFMLARVLYVHVGRAIWMGSLKKRRVRGSRLRVILMFIRSAFFQICHPYRTDIAMGMFSDCIPILSYSPNRRKSHYNIMEEI